jgi:glycerol-1-phosphate dehydrogenase [NAD(P)+]
VFTAILAAIALGACRREVPTPPLKLGADVLHGEKVGIASRFCLLLQGEYNECIDQFFHHFGVPKAFPGCDGMTRQQMCKVFDLARAMRPGRRTILDEFSDDELAARYECFVLEEAEFIPCATR